MKVRVNRYYLAFVLVVWEQLAPVYIRQFFVRNVLLDLFYTMVSFAVGFRFIFGRRCSRRYRIKPLLYLVLFPFAMFIASTFQNGGNVYQTIVLFLRIMLYCQLVGVLVDDKSMLSVFLHAVRDITMLYFAANIIAIILFPGGIAAFEYVNFYLYGNPNTMIRYVVPGLCCSSLIDIQNGKKLSAATVFFLAGLLFTYIYTYFSVTSFLGTLFICMWLMLKDVIQPKMRVTRLAYYFVLVFVLLFEVYVVISASGTNYAVLINSFFGKTDQGGAVSRLGLWARAAVLFMRKPFMGWGCLDKKTLLKLVGNGSGAHNYFLDIAYQRGIVGLGALLAVFIYSLYRVTKMKYISDAGYVLMGYSCMCFLMFLAEPFTTTEPLFMPIIYMFISQGLKEKYIISVPCRKYMFHGPNQQVPTRVD